MNNSLENQYRPEIVSPPGDTLFEILEEKGISQAELAERTGRPKKTINEIIKGKTAITPETAIQFEKVLGTPAHFWITRESTYREWLARQEERKSLAEYIPWMRKFPLRAMIQLGWIAERGEPINQVEELLKYFGVSSPVQWQNMLEGTQWRQSPTFAADPAPVSAWLRQGEIQAQQIECAPYDREHFRTALTEIRGITNDPPEIFVNKIVRLCAEAGVAVVFVPEIPGTHVCGVTRWLTPSKALILLSLRYKTDDHLWFTFFHEAGHILLHGKREVFVEDDDGLSQDASTKEAEADAFAAELLIPRAEMQKFIRGDGHYRHEDIISFAHHLGIAPGIVVGRLQYEKMIPPQNFNRLKRHFDWVNTENFD